jgi:hypothetical protein
MFFFENETMEKSSEPVILSLCFQIHAKVEINIQLLLFERSRLFWRIVLKWGCKQEQCGALQEQCGANRNSVVHYRNSVVQTGTVWCITGTVWCITGTVWCITGFRDRLLYTFYFNKSGNFLNS